MQTGPGEGVDWEYPTLPPTLPGKSRRELRERHSRTAEIASLLWRSVPRKSPTSHYQAAFDLPGAVRLLFQSVDRISPERRSWNMARIRGCDTSPELFVRSLLHRMGFRFRLHCKNLPGRPDIVLPRHRKVVLVHGCYWHRHAGCKYAYSPKSRVEFWTQKFERNITRDRETLVQLEALGWSCLVVWECETRDIQAVTTRLKEFLECPVRGNNVEIF